jgi:hypothetical protein
LTGRAELITDDQLGPATDSAVFDGDGGAHSLHQRGDGVWGSKTLNRW